MVPQKTTIVVVHPTMTTMNLKLLTGIVLTGVLLTDVVFTTLINIVTLGEAVVTTVATVYSLYIEAL